MRDILSRSARWSGLLALGLAQQCEGAQRGLAYVRSAEEALEVYFFSRLPPPMAEALEQDIKELNVSRENYFYSLLDARYRQLISRAAIAAGRKGSGAKKKAE